MLVSELVDLPMNFANGIAGMNWPSVPPVGVTLYVRDEATVTVLTPRVDGETLEAKLLELPVVTGRISSVPELELPEPNKLERMSSSAVVAPGSISIVVELPFCVPSVAIGVKLSVYFIVCAETLATRTSDWKFELFAPLVCATPGMISESGCGVLRGTGETGVTTLTEIGTDVTAEPLLPIFPELPYVTSTVPVFVPRFRVPGAAVTVSVAPAGPTMPEAGVAVSHGLSVVAVKGVGVCTAGSRTVCTTLPSAPASVLDFADFTSTLTGITKRPRGRGPGAAWGREGWSPRTR